MSPDETRPCPADNNMSPDSPFSDEPDVILTLPEYEVALPLLITTSPVPPTPLLDVTEVSPDRDAMFELTPD